MNNPTRKILLLLLLLIYIQFVLLYGFSYISIENDDFASFHSAGRLTFEDNQSPYNYDKLIQKAGFIVPPYLYPPPSLLLFYPLSLIPYQVAKIILLITSHLSILVFIFIFFFKILNLKFDQPFAVFAIIYTFLYFPIVHTLWLGQVNLLVLVFLCLTWYALQKNCRSGVAALPLSLAILIKTYPALFLFYLLSKKKYAIVLWVIGLLFVYSFIASISLPQGVWSDWLTKVLPSGGYGKAAMNVLSPAHPVNQSINGFISRIFIKNEYSESLFHLPAAAKILTYAISILVIMITTGLCYLSSKRNDAKKLIHLEFSLYLLTMFMVSPFSWEHHLAFVLPSIILIMYLLVYSEDNIVFVIIVGLSSLLLAWKLPIAHPLFTKGILTFGISIKLYAVISLWIYLVIKLNKSLKYNSDLQILYPPPLT